MCLLEIALSSPVALPFPPVITRRVTGLVWDFFLVACRARCGPGSLAQVHICITMRHSDSAKTHEIATLISDKNSHICDFQSVNLDLMSTYEGAGGEAA